MLFWLLVVVGVALVGYGVVTQFNNTDKDDPLPKRVWASVVAGALVLLEAVTGWLQGMVG